MDLLEENKKKNQKTSAQKLVLTLLIISIILCIIIGIVMALLELKGEKKSYSIVINGKKVDLNKVQILNSENGQKYIPLKIICNQLNYNYYNGEFEIAEEDKNKGYIDNGTNIIQFFADSEKIYKTSEQTDLDYEYYNLDNKILKNEDNLYISLEDLDIALNLILNYSKKENQTTITSADYWISQRKKAFEGNGVTIDKTPENLKTLSHGYIVISKDGKFGVIGLNGEELIGNKYASITFSEYTEQFIVSNINNQFGIISKNGLGKINLQYDSIEIINHNPLLYKVKKSDKYGIMKADGSIINEIIYDSIAYQKNIEREINYTLIVPNLNENIPYSIVVCIDKKYGLLGLEDGEIVLPCNLDGIYSATDNGKIYYIVESGEKKTFLETYIENLNRLTVNLR